MTFARASSFLLLLGSAACATNPTSEVAQSDCSTASFPADRFVSASFTDKFTGRYHNNSEQVAVWREDQRLHIGEPGVARVQLQRSTEIAGEGFFRDGCNAAYHSVLPTHGPGGMLTIRGANEARSVWERR